MMDFDEPEQLPSQPDDLLGRPLIGGAGGNIRRVQKARLALYGSHALAAWGQRSWEFAVGLIMLEVWPQSLALVSAYGLADQASQVTNPIIAKGICIVLDLLRQSACSSTCMLEHESFGRV